MMPQRMDFRWEEGSPFLAVLGLFLEFLDRSLAVNLISSFHGDSPFQERKTHPEPANRSGRESLLSTNCRTFSGTVHSPDKQNQNEQDQEVASHAVWRQHNDLVWGV